MISADNDLIERIVANVLAELQPAPQVRAPLSGPASAEKSEPACVEIDLPVVTADVLEARVRPGQSVRLATRSILTPSARDWLAKRKLAWSRLPANSSSANPAAARWHLVLTTVTPAVATLRQSLSGWKIELLGTPQETADQAIRVICTGEADGVLALCGFAETVACVANRNQKLRAAVLPAGGDLPRLVEQLHPNLLVMDPRGRSFVELRNLVRAVGALPKPGERDPWASGS